MFIGVARRRIQIVKEVGKTKMSVGVIAYYNLMQVCQGDQHNFPQNQDQMSSFFGQNVDLHPSWDCPRNYVIFDRTDNYNQVMYNPGINTAPMQKDKYTPRVTEEDSADIDALLSNDDEDEEEYEDDEVSTARTYGDDTYDTSDSCSSRRRNKWVGSTSSHGSKGSSGKREKMKKMVKSLRGIVPGGNAEMNTVDVLDEAVKYLKSLKVEAHKMGFGNLPG